MENINRYEFTKEYLGKVYNVYVIENIKVKRITKVGLISQPARVHFSYSSTCKSKSIDEHVRDQLKKISEFVMDASDIELTESLDTSCKGALTKSDQSKLIEHIIGQFNPAKSFLMKCLNNKKAADRIAGSQGLYEAISGILDNYLIEVNAVKNGGTSFKIGCETVEEKKDFFNAKYDDSTKRITLPVIGKKVAESACFSIDANITHEYMHHAGLKTEGDLKLIESICMEANNPEVYKKTECRQKTDFKTVCKTGESCNAGMPEAIQNAVSKEVKKDREAMVPALKAELKDIKLENVIVPSETNTQTKISSNNNMLTINTSDSPTSFNSSIRALSSVMQTNMNRIGAAVDKAIEATVQPAVASTGKSTDSTTKTARLDLGSGKSAKFNGVQKIAGNLKSGDLGPDEYIAEEIIADKYGVPVSEVQKIARGFENEAHNKQEMIGLNSPASNLPSEVAGSAVNAGNNSTSSSSAGLAGADSGNGFGSSARAGAVKSGPNRGTASVQDEVDKPSFSGLGQTKELLGLDYQKLRKKYDDPSFHSALTKDNVRIHVKTDGRKIGSRLQDATVYIDSGRSLVRKK